MENNKKTKRFYKNGEFIWIKPLKQKGRVKEVIKSDKKIVVTTKDGKEITEYTFDLWNVDKFRTFEKAEDVPKQETQCKTTYFASVKGGIIPTKDEENGGYDCYARLEPLTREGKEVYELHIPKLTLAKIPLGFASYLDKTEVLSLKHERSSVGSAGLINVSGLVDSTYQGEIILQAVPLTHDVVISSEVEEKYLDEATNTYFLPYHKALCQAVILKLSEAEVKHISYEELLNKPSTRGTRGWGSTGK